MTSNLWQDIRHAVRGLMRRPLVSGVAVASLALGIGINSAIFSAFERLFLRRLPVPAAAEIVEMRVSGPRPGNRSAGDGGGLPSILSYPLFRDVEREQGPGIVDVFAHRDFGASVSYAGQSSGAEGILVSGSYFSALRLNPALGRLLGPEDDRIQGGHPVVVLSHAYWSTRFGADRSVVGRALLVNGSPMTIVGVAPDGFAGTTVLDAPEIFMPLAMAATARLHADWDGFNARNDHWLYVSARLAPGVSREQAERLLNARFAVLTREVEYPALRGGLGTAGRAAFLARRVTLDEGERGRNTGREEAQLVLVVLFAVTGLVLAIAATNVANLLLARGADRAPEIAVRLSLGASSAQLVRLLLIEALALGALGGVAAIAVARATLSGLMTMFPASDSSMLNFQVNTPVLLFSVALGLVTGLMFGIVPAVQSVRASVRGGLQAQPGRASATRGARRLRTSLATAQIALATALLAQSGLFVASLVNLSRADIGMRRDGLVMFSMFPGLNGYSPERAAVFFAQVEEMLGGIPGVRSVSASTVPVMADSRRTNNVTVERFTAPAGADTQATYADVGPRYFATIGLPLLGGREFTVADDAGAPKVAIVNEAFARKFNLGQSVIGARMARGEGGDRPLDIEIVGLVRDAQFSELRGAPPPQFFVPYRQGPIGPLTFYVHVNQADAIAVMKAIPAVVARLDPNLPVGELNTMTDRLWESTTRDRILSTLSASFASLATLLAAVGLYAVLAYGVARRVREMGIRMALGATGGQVRRLVLRHVVFMGLVGSAVGCALAIGLGRLGQSLLFGVEGVEPRVLVGAAAIVLTIAFLAGSIPARRAAAINPAEALRAE
jgi:putative ABC transport system permease protein